MTAWNSIRWRLPLSYAVIALLSTFALGAILLTTLRSYYDQRERDYLQSNVNTIRAAISQMFDQEMPLAVIQAQIVSYSFLSQVHIQVFDTTGGIIADSGLPHQQNFLSISAQPNEELPSSSDEELFDDGFRIVQTDVAEFVDIHSLRAQFGEVINLSDSANVGEEYYTPVISLDFVPDVERTVTVEDSSSRTVDDGGLTYVLPATSTLFGFGLNDELTEPNQFSRQQVHQEIYTSDGGLVGTVLLSSGPAYGRQIVDRVARGWLVASSLAVAIATGAGWSVSRYISVPLLKLKMTTEAMRDGDLSVRADIHRDDELGLLAQVFNNMAQRIEETVVTLRRFVADAAHELHTPLTALQTNLELAVDEWDVQARQSYIRRAHIQVKRLEALTDGLLDLSRIEARMSEVQYETLSFTDLVQEISEIYASRSEQAEVNFVLNLPDKPIMVYGNSVQLRRVLNNLLDNALKFSPQGETVSLSLREDGASVYVAVKDNGIGIPESELPYIFDRFHRCRNASDYTGSGLGLAIVKGIVNAHAGNVTVHAASSGTEFVVQIPLDDNDKGEK